MIGALAWRLALMAVLWWALTDGAVPRGAGLAVAFAAVAGATLAGLALRRSGARRPRLRRLPRFVAYFLWQSVRGGADVARRALWPSGTVNPGFVVVDPRLSQGTPRTVLIAVMSVMPGTLVAEQLDPQGPLRVHVLDMALPVHDDLARLEREVRRLFALE